ncbi:MULTISPECIES: helix-turn-helix transcriptional regulator [Actinotignum]|uniref:helix-turn-helix transcriptional regulator n=1 Tax=Actinotignum TaxID=1653174 RepID=UPI00254FF8CB|nr:MULTISPECIES: LuxR C-terminal-related transcriptional regulator [Actinotignum]MDE1537062.1 LuxR C-terminal-related transcriptional regulator [Actinotignum schaalii]MDK6629633.1 LuxR C-terminal-related transcriptional regulator [Actinotignum timonense]MDK7272206.1 LuxR C-terminal-related transcriptional regulator [Actinotignum schaalii]MDY5134110.1 LuxR C-terminal-related transcriptional regulator [Actinotignum timonense]MDY5144536.1 LuxR C-terminal-related transcriptional regulator [Actinot
MRTNLQFSQRLTDAIQALHSATDRRTIARYVVALLADVAPNADYIYFYAFLPRQNVFAVLGVYGFPHYNSTLVVEANSPFGRTLGRREQYWARTPAEVAELYSFPADSSLAYERMGPLFRFASAATHASAVIQPCIIGQELQGTLWLESHSRAGAFSATDRTRISQLSTLVALLLRAVPQATILNSDGLAEVWDVLPRTTQITAETPANSASENRPPRTDSRHAPALTLREKDVLTQIAQGLTNSEAAAALHISINTVRSHRRSLMRKFAVHNAVELLDAAAKYGLEPKVLRD